MKEYLIIRDLYGYLVLLLLLPVEDLPGGQVVARPLALDPELILDRQRCLVRNNCLQHFKQFLIVI